VEYIAAKFILKENANLLHEFNAAIKAFPASSEELRKCKAMIGVGLEELEIFPPAYLLQLASQQPESHPAYLSARPFFHPDDVAKSTETPLILEWINKPEHFDTCMLILKDHSASVNSVKFSPDGTLFASASKDNSIKIHDGVSGEMHMVLHGHKEDVRSIAISNDGLHLVTAGQTGIIRFWDAKSGMQMCTLTDMETTVINSVGFSCDGELLAAGGEACKVAIYQRQVSHNSSMHVSSADAWKLVGWLVHSKIISSLEWHPTNPDALITGEGGQVTHTIACADISSSPESLKRLSQFTGACTANVWDTKSQTRMALLQGHDGTNDCLCDGSAQIECPIQGHRGDVLSVSWSPTDETIATASRDCTVRLWAVDGTPIWCSERQDTACVNCVAISPDGSRVASGGDDANICLWDITDGSLLKLMSGHNGWVYCLSWSPDSCVLVSGSRDMSVRLWDLTTKESLQLSLDMHRERERITREFTIPGESEIVRSHLAVASPKEFGSASSSDKLSPSKRNDDIVHSSPTGFLARGKIAMGAVSVHGKRVVGIVSGQVTATKAVLKDKLEDAFEDTMELVCDKFGSQFERIGDFAESAHDKFNIAKALARGTAAAAVDLSVAAVEKMQVVAEAAMDQIDDIKGSALRAGQHRMRWPAKKIQKAVDKDEKWVDPSYTCIDIHTNS
jgi:WD40 repeat protein